MTAVRFEVVLTAGARADLGGIRDYLVAHGAPEAASQRLDDFTAVMASLQTFPVRGSVPKELEAIGMRDYRQILLGPYRIIYRIIAERVIVAVIIDGRRDLKALLEWRLLRG